jgi:hypothetical protein
MTSVGIDENGQPKASAFDSMAPLSRRSAVAAMEGSGPAESAGIETSG